VHFPLLLYKKLLGSFPFRSYTERRPYNFTLKDVKETFPEVGKNLQALLDYPGDDVEDAFGMTFQVSSESFGQTESHALVPGGAQKPVTKANRAEFVAKYVDYLLSGSVENQFTAFRKGFITVAGGAVLLLYNAEELSVCCEGASDEIDSVALEKAARYDGGYHAKHPVIQAFWQVVHSWPQEQRRKFLLFATGTDRIPSGGIGTLPFIIQRAGTDTQRLPTASTCYNLLLLPEYSSAEKLRRKLETAIEYYQGFGLK